LDVVRKRYFDANREAFGGGAGDAAGERLRQAAISEQDVGEKVLQPAYVYGSFCPSWPSVGAHPDHPLKPEISLVFRHLEPVAFEMWDREIADLADNAGNFDWPKETYFGSLF
jgi:hypothetical protein